MSIADRSRRHVRIARVVWTTRLLSSDPGPSRSFLVPLGANAARTLGQARYAGGSSAYASVASARSPLYV
jgi:hypothetical protein